MTRMRQSALIVGLVTLAGCLDWDPPDRCEGVTCTNPEERCIEETGLCGVPSCNGGLLDLTSGLCWQNPSLDASFDWEGAVAYCNALDLGGHGPGSWHLPTIDEMRTFIRGCPETETGGSCGVTESCPSAECMERSECIGCPNFGGPGMGGAYWPEGVSGPSSSYCYWSSSDAEGSSGAWAVFFNTGNVGHEEATGLRFVRCVRPGP